MASLTDFKDDAIALAITEMVERRIAEVILEESEGVANRVRERIGGEIGAIAGRVLSFFEMERQGHSVLIRVDTRKLAGGDA